MSSTVSNETIHLNDRERWAPEHSFLTESSSVDHRTAHILANPRKPGVRSDRRERVGCEKSGKYTQYVSKGRRFFKNRYILFFQLIENH